MSDIRCPMCGKPNPPEAETCWSCQARLKPLLASQPGDTPGKPEQPDWLSGLRGSSAEEDSGWTGDSAGEDQSSGEVPDWLARIRAQRQEDDPGDAGDADWLKALGGNEEDQPAAEESPAAGAESDWLGSLRAGQPSEPSEPGEPPASEDQETGDWMANLSAWAAPVEGSQPNESQQAAGEDDMSWLSSFQAPAEPPAASEPAGASAFLPGDQTPPADAAGEDLDWLSSLDLTPQPPAAQPPASPAPAESADWFAPQPETPPPANEPPGEQSPFEIPAGENGEWLSQLPSQQTNEETYSSSDGELSDWFSGLNLNMESSGEVARPEPPFETPVDNQPSAPSPFAGEEPPAEPGETPDWLKVFGTTGPAEPPESRPPAPEEAAAPAVMPFASSDMPDWLGSAEEGAKTEKAAEEGAPEGLEEAQLPGWLQAMRPVEAVVPVETPADAKGQTIERAGPLAGMVGMVPGEEIVNRVRKPSVYSSRLHVSEIQRVQSALLEEMLSEEARPRQARAERSHVPQRLVRLLIALLLLVVVGLPLVGGTGIMPLPELFPPETVSFRTQVEGLPANAPVLLAVDYDPGLSEELSLASASVLDHLMAKNARLTTLSTVPYGPVLADSLLRSAAERNSAFNLEQSSINLGFLPGGTAGLQEFASRPQMALRNQLNGEPAWDTPVLQGVNGIGKFALVIVLTENAETARAWIEQVQPRLENVPLLFVISAQSAPFIHPYIDSGQAQGMVAGMSGGIAYAQIAHQPASAARLWDAYQFGLFAAILLILIGGMWSLVRLLFTRAPAQKGA